MKDADESSNLLLYQKKKNILTTSDLTLYFISWLEMWCCSKWTQTLIKWAILSPTTIQEALTRLFGEFPTNTNPFCSLYFAPLPITPLSFCTRAHSYFQVRDTSIFTGQKKRTLGVCALITVLGLLEKLHTLFQPVISSLDSGLDISSFDFLEFQIYLTLHSLTTGKNLLKKRKERQLLLLHLRVLPHFKLHLKREQNEAYNELDFENPWFYTALQLTLM